MEPYRSNAGESHMGGDNSKGFEIDKYDYFIFGLLRTMCFC
jgi:hypothetical protein